MFKFAKNFFISFLDCLKRYRQKKCLKSIQFFDSRRRLKVARPKEVSEFFAPTTDSATSKFKNPVTIRILGWDSPCFTIAVFSFDRLELTKCPVSKWLPSNQIPFDSNTGHKVNRLIVQYSSHGMNNTIPWSNYFQPLEQWGSEIRPLEIQAFWRSDFKWAWPFEDRKNWRIQSRPS